MRLTDEQRKLKRYIKSKVKPGKEYELEPVGKDKLRITYTDDFGHGESVVLERVENKIAYIF